MYNREELSCKKLLSREEAAFYVGVSPGTMHTIMHSPDFPAFIRIGAKRVFVNREVLDEWINARTSNAMRATK